MIVVADGAKSLRLHQIRPASAPWPQIGNFYRGLWLGPTYFRDVFGERARIVVCKVASNRLAEVTCHHSYRSSESSLNDGGCITEIKSLPLEVI
jgi:hypothetical protein